MLPRVTLAVVSHPKRMVVYDLRVAPKSSRASVWKHIDPIISLISSAAVKPIAVALVHLNHPRQPAGASEVRIAPKEDHHLTRHLLRGQLKSTNVKTGIVVFEKLTIRQTLEQESSFLGAASAVADYHRVVKMHRRVGVIARDKFYGSVEMAITTVLGKNVRADHFHLKLDTRVFKASAASFL